MVLQAFDGFLSPRMSHPANTNVFPIRLVLSGLMSLLLFPSNQSIASEYSAVVLPLLERYCFECHARDVAEAEIDFSAFASEQSLGKDPSTWLKTRNMLDSGQMPPKDAPQPTDQERQAISNWLHRYLKQQAQATAGDPGPVVLRRLNNEEYNYTVRDLTGLTTLNPTREFPVDGAAGEGFINTGAAQAMSPAMVDKYLAAAKEIAEHLVLLPDGITFSPGRSQREWTEERLQAIRDFYGRYTVTKDVFVDVGGTGTVSNQGGAIPLARYLAATVRERDAIRSGRMSLSDVAADNRLNPKYLRKLWDTLNRSDGASSFWLDSLRERWNASQGDHVGELVAFIESLQEALWTFHSIGQLTEGGNQKTWMSPKSPIVTHQEFRVPVPTVTTEHADSVTMFLAAHSLNESSPGSVLWERPRLEFQPNDAGWVMPPVLLSDLPGLLEGTRQFIDREAARLDQYLTALTEASRGTATLEIAAQQRGLHLELLRRLAESLNLESQSDPEITGHFTQRMRDVQGYSQIHGWGSPQTPSVLVNESTQDVSFLTLTVPARGVVVHPSPSQESVIAWRSPFSGHAEFSGMVADMDAQCGNGAAWRIERESAGSATELLSEGVLENGGRSEWGLDQGVNLRKGDVIRLIVNPRDQNHACDTTQVDFSVTESGSQKRSWQLSADVVDRFGDSNPLPDRYGNASTWHFCISSVEAHPAGVRWPVESAVPRWLAALRNGASDAEMNRLSREVQHLLMVPDDASLSTADRQCRDVLLDWLGPLRWIELAKPMDRQSVNAPWRVVEAPFEFGGDRPDSQIAPTDLPANAPSLIRLNLPAHFASRSELVVSATCRPENPESGAAVQVQVTQSQPQDLGLSPTLPFLIDRLDASREPLEASLERFRDLFPAALCYSRIVPVDEVVTLTLFFREDEALQRLMLNETEIAELNRLWDDLLFVAQEPIALNVALEQIYEFATQDRPDLVEVFGPMRDPIGRRAAEFRERLVDVEPVQVNAILEFASRAWRRPLSQTEEQKLAALNTQLRRSELNHEDSVRLLLARVLTSPSFLYRRERAAPGRNSQAVSDHELATRLSYFLWSSTPDANLRRLADEANLASDSEILRQTHRMLDDDRIRRLAVQFACQWLHVRNFDQNDDKNEQLYPQFAALRGDLYEETIRFFEDLFRHNGSILDILNADHTFVNQTLANHYGIQGIEGDHWRRVDSIRRQGRGGILAMGTFLASQSGASRTSPILRGNWIYETLLGERLPRPPAGVPVLPEEVPQGLTARELIEQHSSVAQCARCHQKIDPYGFALEQYDAIGRLRTSNVDTSTTLDDGVKVNGLSELRKYLTTVQRDRFVRQFCRKLLGFALGREVQLSDEPLLDKMQHGLADDDYRFHSAVETIVLSPPFRQIRGRQAIDTPTTTGAPP